MGFEKKGRVSNTGGTPTRVFRVSRKSRTNLPRILFICLFVVINQVLWEKQKPPHLLPPTLHPSVLNPEVGQESPGTRTGDHIILWVTGVVVGRPYGSERGTIRMWTVSRNRDFQKSDSGFRTVPLTFY